MPTHRKLAAILSADAAGYSRLMADDEAATLRSLNDTRALFRERIQAHGGRLIDTAGDSILAEFPSAVEAVDCAVEIQHELSKRNSQLAEHRRMQFRIGINLGDVIEQEDGTIYGDGVNVAARLQQLAEPGEICVSGTAYDQVEGKLPLAFKFIGEQQVKNIAKPVRAYRLFAKSPMGFSAHPSPSVRFRKWVVALSGAGILVILATMSWLWQGRWGDLREAGSDATLALPKGPSIAVLPFTNMSGDSQKEYFADGITEDIITGLSRFRDLFVIARNSTFQYKGKAVDVREVGKDLGVQFVLEGSVRREKSRIRVTAQLLDASSGAHLWADTYDRDLTTGEIFDIQDEITAKVVSKLGDPLRGMIFQVESRQARKKGAVGFEAFDCVLQGKTYFATFDSTIHQAVRECLERTVKTHPEYADAWAYLAVTITDEYALGYNPRPNSLEHAVEAAKRAISLDPENQVGHWFLARALFFKHDLEQFLQVAERAVSLNPNNTAVCAGAAVYMSLAGQWDKGKALMERAIALNPNHPGWYHMPLFFYHYRKAEFQTALTHAQKWQQGLPTVYLPYIALAAVYGQLNRQEEASAAVNELLKLKSNFPENAWGEFRKFNIEPNLAQRMSDGLRKAGLTLPEEKS